MLRIRKHLLFILICVSIPLYLVSGAPAEKNEESLTAALVQYKVSLDNYRDFDAFRDDVGAIVQQVMSEETPDLIIFPEYIGVFLVFSPYLHLFSPDMSIEEAFMRLKERYPRFEELKEIFLWRGGRVAKELDHIWQSLAYEYEVAIIGGTCFTPVTGGELRNRCSVYFPDSRPPYRQDKVFLTPFEKELLGIEPGSLSDADSFSIKGCSFGITICRDTFFDEWHSVFEDVSTWIDIKANGEHYTQDTVSLFLKALPERLALSEVDQGATVCLTGKFLDLLWEGSSAFYRETSTGVAAVQSAVSVKSEEILLGEFYFEAKALEEK